MKTRFSIAFLLISIFVLSLAACGTPVVPELSPTPEIQEQATAEPTQPAQPTEAPAAEETATPRPAEGTAPSLTGTWQWIAFSDPQNGPADIANPENYLITFNEDGTVLVKADCNTAQGTYNVDGSTLTIQTGPTTQVYCGDASRGDDFLKYLSYAASYQLDDKGLHIDLIANGGTLILERSAEGLSTAPDETAALPAELATGLDEYIQGLVYTEGGDPTITAPGIVLLVDTPQGRYLKAAGVSNMDDQTPMKADDTIEIGSITKSFIAVLLLQLQEEGVLSLDDPLSKWLPDWAEKIPYGDQMILRQFANHTSGVRDYGDPITDAVITDPELRVKKFTPGELVEYGLALGDPDFKPGEPNHWKYSNTGYILLGMVIEKATGKSLPELAQERIFDPVGMKSARFVEDVPTPDVLTSRGYNWPIEGSDNVGDTLFGDRVDVSDWNLSQGWAAGGMTMTVEDLLAYSKALTAGDLFKDPASLQEMTDFKQFTTDEDNLNYLYPYGLGVMDFSESSAPGYWGHEGSVPGFQGIWLTNPDKGVTIIGFGNSGRFGAVDFLSIVEEYLGD